MRAGWPGNWIESSEISWHGIQSHKEPRTPWQTLTAVNNHAFKRGDKVLLTGTFTGESLVLGTHANGVTVNSYVYNPVKKTTKVGVPNVAAFTDLPGDGVDILTSNLTVENLTLTADPSALSTGAYNYGIHLFNSGSVVLSHETINEVTASGFSYSGLCMQGWNTSATDSAGFANVLIENSSFFGNAVSGLFAAAGNSSGNDFQPEFPATLYLNSNLTIRNIKAYDNAGFNPALTGVADVDQLNQGTSTSGGIFISSVNKAVVENCTVFTNNFNGIGSVGTWAFDASRVLFQNDESYDTKNIAGIDGEGFDFDHGVTNSIMQRDFSHGNAGFGFLIAANGGTSNDNHDTIRYCIRMRKRGHCSLSWTPDAKTGTLLIILDTETGRHRNGDTGHYLERSDAVVMLSAWQDNRVRWSTVACTMCSTAATAGWRSLRSREILPRSSNCSSRLGGAAGCGYLASA
jgi:hypothetical protein